MTPTLPQHIHCVGIGGIGMSGLALLLLERGHQVSGSDVSDSPLLQRLRDRGARVFVEHDARHVGDAAMVIHSTCIADDNPEMQQARQTGTPILHRAEALARLLQGRHLITVSGAHGKTTTTGLITHVLMHAGADPTFYIGAEVESLHAYGGHARLGRGRSCVVEADESDGSLLQFQPDIAVLTNIDDEHLDYYGTSQAIHETFAQFMRGVRPAGTLWVCADDAALWQLAQGCGRHLRTFGLTPAAEVSATEVVRDRCGSAFRVRLDGTDLGRFSLRIPGVHNVSNALAAIGLGWQLGVEVEPLREALARFSGAHRRFRYADLPQDITVIDDYAHHPTEIRATLAAIDRGAGRRVVAVFQPHRYSRTQLLHRAWLTCFDEADRLLVTDIYAAFEQPIAGVTAERLVAAMHDAGRDFATYVPKAHLVEEMSHLAQPGDILVLLGAGDIGACFHELVEQLSQLSAV